MIILLSPAKTMDFQSHILTGVGISKPLFQNNANTLNTILKGFDEQYIKEIMNLSDRLLPQVINSINKFTGNIQYCSQAIFAYQGAVFKALDPAGLNKEQLDFAQDNLRILSGLYGVLKPLDGIEEYRLEMKTKLKIMDSHKMYEYWKDIISNYFKNVDKPNVIINLASKEYSKVIDFSKINAAVINIFFGESVNNTIKYPPMYSKMARGEMAGFIIRNYITDPEDIKNFNLDSYLFNNKLSTENNYIFTR